MDAAEYWQEAAEIALDEMGLYHLVEGMTAEQRTELGKALAAAHQNYRKQALHIATGARKAAREAGQPDAIGIAAAVEYRLSEAGIAWGASDFDSLTPAECRSDERLADRILRAGR